MTTNSLTELTSQLQVLFREEEYSAALKLARESRGLYPEHRAILDFWTITMTARLGDSEGALQAFADALEQGSWFSELLLRRSPSLQALQDDPQFESLILRNQDKAESDQESRFPFFTLRPEGKCRSGGPPCPLLIGLHANGGTVQTSIDFWKPAAALGWLVAAPQSSQALMKGVHVWDDRETAEQEIQHDYSVLLEHYSVNPWQTVLAGHALGAEIAIWLAVKGSLDISKFLAIGAVGAWMDDLKNWDELLGENLRQGLRGYLIVGELDETVAQEQTAELVDIFNNAGIETELEMVPSAENDYVPDYDPAIRRGLNFLAG